MPEPPEEAPDLQALARRFLDLWQDQVAAMAENADLAEQFGRLMAALSGLGVPVAKRGDFHGKSGEPGAAAPAGAAAAALSPGGGGDDLARLARRLDGIERRLARLDAAGGAPARRRPRRPRS
jgi:hypothetical protein